MVMDQLGAELALAEAEAARRRTRVMLRAIRLPIRLAGIVDLVGAGVVLLVGREHLLVYFGPAFIVLLVVSALHYRREGRRSGMQLPMLPWVAILLGMVATASSLSRMGFALELTELTLVGPFLANAAATAVVAVWLRSRRLLTTSVGMVAIAVLSVASPAGADATGAAVLGVYGVLLLVAAREETL